MNLAKALQDAVAATYEGRQVLLKHFRNLTAVREKHRAGLVSEADLESEQVITAYLKKCYPQIPMLGEEGSYAKGHAELPGRDFWVLDPLDGTTNYVHGFHVFCISLALVLDGAIQLAVVDVPILKDTYHAIAGQGAFKNKNPIRVSKTSAMKDSLLATGFFSDDHPALDEQLKIFSRLVYKARGIRRAGAAAYDLCCVAEGVYDAFWEKNLKPWDTAAGVLLVREAGGVAKNYEGSEYEITNPSLIASNTALLEPLLEELRSI
jgi:myo-inositol-1(or 4)-monophosphatase